MCIQYARSSGGKGANDECTRRQYLLEPLPGLGLTASAHDDAIICDKPQALAFSIRSAIPDFHALIFKGIAPGTSEPAAPSNYFNGGSSLFNNSGPIGGEIEMDTVEMVLCL
jgi:hypothetical protein